MRKTIFWLALCLICINLGYTSDDQLQLQTHEAPDAIAILNQVRAHLPRHPVTLCGQLLSGPLRGGFKHSYQIEINFDLNQSPMLAEYVLRDAFGSVRERMTVLRHSTTNTELRYMRGDPGTIAELPAPHTCIQATDITWDDLTMDFLWWPEARVIGHDTFRGRACVILELKHPAQSRDNELRRLWVDTNIGMFLQMEVWRAGRAERRMIARSFKKIKEQWMVKDIELRSLTRSHRTLLRIEDII